MRPGVDNPVTPQPRAARNLWPSPSFSDYFSGDEYSPTPAKATLNGQAQVTPSQQRLLHRLNEIGNQILRSNLDGQTPGIVDSELDALEQTLNAPESQSRAPAELEDSGLFIDDEAEDERRENLEYERLAAQAKHDAQLEEGREVVARVSEVTERLQKRYDEVKVSIRVFLVCRLQQGVQRLYGASPSRLLKHVKRPLSVPKLTC
jgi:hypothetical protein